VQVERGWHAALVTHEHHQARVLKLENFFCMDRSFQCLPQPLLPTADMVARVRPIRGDVWGADTACFRLAFDYRSNFGCRYGLKDAGMGLKIVETCEGKLIGFVVLLHCCEIGSCPPAFDPVQVQTDLSLHFQL
jgi:hypothetical protein